VRRERCIDIVASDGGNQQYTVRAFEITSQTAACICLLWDWGWTWSGLTLISAPVGISLINPESPDVNLAGSIYVMDSLFADIPVAIEAHFMKETILETSIITLDNIGMINVDSSVTFEDGSFLELPAGDIDFVIIGNIELNGDVYGSYT
jgi:glucan 1,3-beta-glucosidase